MNKNIIYIIGILLLISSVNADYCSEVTPSTDASDYVYYQTFDGETTGNEPLNWDSGSYTTQGGSDTGWDIVETPSASAKSALVTDTTGAYIGRFHYPYNSTIAIEEANPFTIEYVIKTTNTVAGGGNAFTSGASTSTQYRSLYHGPDEEGSKYYYYSGGVQTSAYTTTSNWDNLVYTMYPLNDTYDFTANNVIQDRGITNRISTPYAQGGLQVDNVNIQDKFWISAIYVYTGSDCPEAPSGFSFTMDYPSDLIYNDYTGYINITTTASSYCSVNNSNWINQTSSGTNQKFLNSGTADGIYDIYINCSQIGGAGTYADNLSFSVDTTNPIISSNVELNNTYQTGEINLLINFTDTNLKNYTIFTDCFTRTNTSLVNPSNFNENINVFSCAYGENQINVTACDSLNQCTYKDYTFNNMIRLNLSGYDLFYNTSIQNFTITKDGVSVGNTTDYNLILNNQSQGTYNFSIDAFGYELKYENITLTSLYSTHTFNLYGTNTLRAYVYDENTGATIYNVTLTISSDTYYTNYTTSSGSFYIEDIPENTYNLVFTSEDYISQSYIIVISNRSSTSLNAYLLSNVGSTIFSFTDIDTGVYQQNVLIGQYRIINSTWTLTTSKNTDITGRAQFYYYPNVNYKFISSKVGYQTLTFSLTPILFETYDIRIQKEYTENATTDYDLISLEYAPRTFINDGVNNFTFIIQSPYGELSTYGYTLIFPGGNTSQSGINTYGQRLTSSFNITGATFLDTLTLHYYYSTSNGAFKEFYREFPIQLNESDHTLLINKGDYGMGIFERILLITIMLLFIVGLASLFGSPTGGLVLGLINISYFVYTGFLEWWLFALPIMGGVIYLAFKK